MSLVKRGKPTESLHRPRGFIAPFSDLIPVPVIPRVSFMLYHGFSVV